jgi:hypothetical protein
MPKAPKIGLTQSRRGAEMRGSRLRGSAALREALYPFDGTNYPEIPDGWLLSESHDELLSPTE